MAHTIPTGPMIRAEGLTKQFDGHVAVEALTFEVQPGEVFGFLGPNGAGKTTTVRMLAALIAPTAGEAWVNGHRIGAADREVRASIGLLTETPGLYQRLSPVENLRLFARLQGVGDVQGSIERYLRLFDLWERRTEPVSTFSKGMQQKVAIARALLHEPPVLFLDEPTAALDPEAASLVREAIEVLRSQGRTVFICTHNLAEADRLCNRIGVIRQRLLRVDTPQALRQSMYGHSVLVRLQEVTPGLVDAVRALDFVEGVSPVEGGLRVALGDPPAQNPALVRALVAAGGAVQFVQEEEHSLEQVYFDLMRAARGEE